MRRPLLVPTRPRDVRPFHEPTRAERGAVVLRPSGGGFLRHRITGTAASALADGFGDGVASMMAFPGAISPALAGANLERLSRRVPRSPHRRARESRCSWPVRPARPAAGEGGGRRTPVPPTTASPWAAHGGPPVQLLPSATLLPLLLASLPSLF